MRNFTRNTCTWNLEYIQIWVNIWEVGYLFTEYLKHVWCSSESCDGLKLVLYQEPESSRLSFISEILETLLPYLIVISVVLLVTTVFIILSARLPRLPLVLIIILLCFATSFVIAFCRKYQVSPSWLHDFILFG